MSYRHGELPVLESADLETMNIVDTFVLNQARAFQATERQYTDLISRKTIFECQYHNNFPHLLINAENYHNNDSDEKFCLSPAVCYHIYPEFKDKTVEHKTVITAKNKCFRNETSPDGLRRLREFTMREVVCIGKREEVIEFRKTWMDLVVEFAGNMGITASLQEAVDPFFGGEKVKQRLQRIGKLKYELVAIVENEPLAIASFNIHGNHFSELYNFENNQEIWTSCIAFGLERWLWSIRCLEKN